MNLIKTTFYLLCFIIIILSVILYDIPTIIIVGGIMYIKYSIDKNKKDKINSLTKKIF